MPRGLYTKLKILPTQGDLPAGWRSKHQGTLNKIENDFNDIFQGDFLAVILSWWCLLSSYLMKCWYVCDELMYHHTNVYFEILIEFAITFRLLFCMHFCQLVHICPKSKGRMGGISLFGRKERFSSSKLMLYFLVQRCSQSDKVSREDIMLLVRFFKKVLFTNSFSESILFFWR